MTVQIAAFRNFSKAPKIYVGLNFVLEKGFSLLFVGIILIFNVTSIELQAMER